MNHFIFLSLTWGDLSFTNINELLFFCKAEKWNSCASVILYSVVASFMSEKAMLWWRAALFGSWFKPTAVLPGVKPHHHKPHISKKMTSSLTLRSALCLNVASVNSVPSLLSSLRCSFSRDQKLSAPPPGHQRRGEVWDRVAPGHPWRISEVRGKGPSLWNSFPWLSQQGHLQQSV